MEELKKYDEYWKIDYRELEKEIILGNKCLPEILERRAKEEGDKPYLQFEEKPIYSYREVNAEANRVANFLLSVGLEPNINVGWAQPSTNVSVFMTNSAEHVFTWFGILKAGLTEAPINYDLTGDPLAYQINKVEAKVLFVSDESPRPGTPPLTQRVSEIIEKLPQVKHIIVLSEKEAKIDTKGRKDVEIHDWREINSSSDKNPDILVKATMPSRIIFTSGTTGLPKGVVKTHAGDYLTAFGYIKALRLTPNDVLFTAFPLYHSNAQVVCTYPAMLLGTRVHIYKRVSVTHYWDWIRRTGATATNTLGPLPYWLWNLPPSEKDRDHSLRIMLQSPAPHEPEIFYGFQERFGVTIVDGYGLTETGMVTFNPIEKRKPGSCGRAAIGYEVKIVDPETDVELPPGQVGEIVCRNYIPWVMLPWYYKDPEKSLEAFRNLWFHTGDLGKMDEEGYFYFVDRLKDYIRVKGENVSSYELELLVRKAVPEAQAVAAVGVKVGLGKAAEEEIKLIIVPKPEYKGKLDPKTIMDSLVNVLPRFMIPRYIEFMDEKEWEEYLTPATMRVQKFKLRQRGLTGKEWDRVAAEYVVPGLKK